MTEEFETDRLEVGADMDIINAAATDLGIEATERQKVLAELLPYLAAKGKIATLKILEAYLGLSTQLARTASEIVQGKDELVATHSQGVNSTLVRYAAHIEEALTGGHLLKEGDPDSFLLDSMRQENIDSLIATIGKETESREGGFNGRIIRKERALEEEYRTKAEELVAAVGTFERRNPDCIAALTQALGDNALERVFDLMADPSNVSNTASVSGEATGTASMREGTAGKRENPIDGLMNLVRELERLDRFAKTRADTDINTALRKHDVETTLSDTMNRGLSLKFRVLLDRVPPVTRKEEIAKERTLHEDQIGVLEEIKAFLDMRPQAIRAQHAVVKNGLGGHLEDYRRRAATSPGSDTPTASAQNGMILKTISGEITQLEESLPDLEEAIIDRLEEIRGIVPNIRLDKTEVGASIHNFRQFVFALLALVGTGALVFATGKYTAPDSLDETAVGAAAAAADTAGFTRGRADGLAEGEATGRQATLAGLVAALNLGDLDPNPTVDTIVAAIAAGETNNLEDKKAYLNEIISIAITKRAYSNTAEALEVAGIASVDDLQTAEEAVTAIRNLVEDLALHGHIGISSAGAVTLQQGIAADLDETEKIRLRRSLQDAGNAAAARQVR